MPYIETNMSRESAEDLMIELTASEVPAKLRYLPDGNGATDHEYAVWVDEVDLPQALDALDLEEVAAGSSRSDVQAEEPDSMLSCPRCSQRKIAYPEDPVFRILLMSIPFLMVPALVWLIWTRIQGSRKVCKSCRHEWRSNP